MQHKSNMPSTSSPWISGSRSPLSMPALISWLHRPRERSNHHQPHCQHRHQCQPQRLKQQFLIQQQFLILPDFENPWTSSTGSSSCSTARATSASAANPAIRSATRSDQKKNHKEVEPREATEVAAVIQDINDNHLPISQDQLRVEHQEELLQGLILQEWCQGDLQRYSADQIKSTITKELRQIGPQGHDACVPIPLSSLTLEERRLIIESRWVIGPRPGIQLKDIFCAKGGSSKSSCFNPAINNPQPHASHESDSSLEN